MQNEQWVCKAAGDADEMDGSFMSAMLRLSTLKYGEGNTKLVIQEDAKRFELQVKAGIYGNEVIE